MPASRFSAATLLIALSLSIAPVRAAVGTIEGIFSVSATGSATYTIALDVPPGIANLAPSLALAYDSHAGSGYQGVGWSLAGVSAITRCGKTIVQNGVKRGIRLNAEDRFCLDGQRLIAVSGTYGSPNTEYRTEIDTFSKIISYGGTAGDPGYFKVWTKSGQVLEYGNTADSRAEAQGKTVALLWSINRTSDTVGNYLTYTYTEDAANGEHHIARIDYTGNSSVPTTPYNAVEFVYEARADLDINYVMGSKYQITKRLKAIRTRANGTIAADYRLAYEAIAPTNRSRLTSLTRCASELPGADCLPATSFAWQAGQAGLDATGVDTGIAEDANAWYMLAMDVDGDGITDIVYPTGSTWKVRYGGASGFSAETNTNIVHTGYEKARVLDFNADGRADLMVPSTSTGLGTYRLIKATGNRAVPFDAVLINTGISDASQDRNPVILDLNGDGYPDMLHTYSPNWWVAIGNGSAFGTNTNSNIKYETPSDPTQNYNLTNRARPADLNAQGRAGIYVPFVENVDGCPPVLCEYSYWQTLSLDDSSALAVANLYLRLYAIISYPSWGVLNAQRGQQAVDINLDGNTDMLTTRNDNASGIDMTIWWMCLNWGDIYLESHCAATTVPNYAKQSILQIDWNADGKPDILANDSGPNLRAYLSLESNLGPAIDTGIPSNPTYEGYLRNPLIGDFNGDGLADLLMPQNGTWRLHKHNGVSPDRILTITDGLGAIRTLTYKPLTDTAIYTRGTGAVFPVQDVQDGTHVVTKVATDDGIGGSFNLTYKYSGARTHLQGRGFLGFAAIEQTDPQAGIVTRTEYSQAFPYIGQPTLITRNASPTLQISRIENTLSSKPLNTGTTVFPYVSYSKEQGRELNGTVLPVTETTHTYGDDWGNLTRSVVQTTGGFVTQTDHVYTNDTIKWYLGQRTCTTIARTANAVTHTRVTAYEYHAVTGLLSKEKVEPDQNPFRLDVEYARDAFGNKQSATASSPATGIAAIDARTASVGWGSNGRYPLTVTNALSHVETRTFDARFGSASTLTDANSLMTQWQYDGFGRRTLETRPDTTQTSWAYGSCDASCPATGVYRIVVQTTGAPTTATHLDRLGREVRSVTQGFDGRWIYQDTEYDNQGRIARASRPYYAGGTIYWATALYDALGRVGQAFEPDNPTTAALTMIYNGLTLLSTNINSQTTVTTHDALRQKIQVKDAMNQITAYAYDPFGNLLRTTDPASNQIGNLYDIRGRKTQTTDPDMGVWTYEYDVLNELKQQTDAKSQVTTFAYDKLGRMTQRTEPGLTSTWIWDTSPTAGKASCIPPPPTPAICARTFMTTKGGPSSAPWRSTASRWVR